MTRLSQIDREPTIGRTIAELAAERQYVDFFPLDDAVELDRLPLFHQDHPDPVVGPYARNMLDPAFRRYRVEPLIAYEFADLHLLGGDGVAVLDSGVVKNTLDLVQVSHPDSNVEEIRRRESMLLRAAMPVDNLMAEGQHFIGFNGAWRNHGNWLLQCLPRLYAFTLLRRRFRALKVALPPLPEGSAARATLDLLGIGPDAVTTVPARAATWFAQAMLLPGFEFAATPPLTVAAADALLAGLPPAPSGGAARPDKIFVHRTVPGRALANFEALRPVLERYGFTVVSFEAMNFVEQMATMQAARHVIAEHGAGTANVLFCRESARLLELFNPFAVQPAFWSAASRRGVEYGYVTGRHVATEEHKLFGWHSAYEIAPERLEDGIRAMLRLPPRGAAASPAAPLAAPVVAAPASAIPAPPRPQPIPPPPRMPPAPGAQAQTIPPPPRMAPAPAPVAPPTQAPPPMPRAAPPMPSRIGAPMQPVPIAPRPASSAAAPPVARAAPEPIGHPTSGFGGIAEPAFEMINTPARLGRGGGNERVVLFSPALPGPQQAMPNEAGVPADFVAEHYTYAPPAAVAAYAVASGQVWSTGFVTQGSQYVAPTDCMPGFWRPHLLPGAEKLHPIFSGAMERGDVTPIVLDRPVAVATHPNLGYGRFLLEMLPRLWLLAVLREYGADIPLALSRTVPEWVKAYARLFHADRDIVWYDGANECVRAPTVVMPSMLHTDYNFHPALNLMVRDLVQRLPPEPTSPKLVYLTRSNIGEEKLENQADVEQAARNSGFAVVNVMELAPEQQIRLFAGAKVLVAEHGFALYGALFSPPGTRVVAMNFPNHYLSAIARLRGHRIGYAPPADGRFRHWRLTRDLSPTWRIDLPTLGRAIQEVAAGVL